MTSFVADRISTAQTRTLYIVFLQLKIPTHVSQFQLQLSFPFGLSSLYPLDSFIVYTLTSLLLVLLKYLYNLFLTLKTAIKLKYLVFGNYLVCFTVEKQHGHLFIYFLKSLKVVNVKQVHTHFLLDLFFEEVNSNCSKTLRQIRFLLHDFLYCIPQAFKWAVQNQILYYFSIFLGKLYSCYRSHAPSPNCKFSSLEILIGFSQHFLCIFGFIYSVCKIPTVTIPTPNKVKAYNSYIILTNKRHKAQTLQFAAAISMKVENSVFGFPCLVLQNNSRYKFPSLISNIEINSLKCFSLNILDFRTKRRYIMSKFGRGDDTFPSSFIELGHIDY